MSSLSFPEPSREDFRKLMDRFAAAGWIQASMVTRDPLEIVWSEKGRDRMAELVPVLMKLVPKIFDAEAKRCGQFASVRYWWRFSRLTRELRWGQAGYYSLRQDTALYYIVLRLAEAHRGEGKIAKWFKTSIA